MVDNVYKPARRFCDSVLSAVRRRGPLFRPAHAAGRPGRRWRRRRRAADPDGIARARCPSRCRTCRGSPNWPAPAASSPLIDNTWGAGLLFRPLEHGVDLSIQALTKYVGGHSDVFMGSAAARDPALVRQLADGVHHMGWAVSRRGRLRDAARPAHPAAAHGAARRERPGGRRLAARSSRKWRDVPPRPARRARPRALGARLQAAPAACSASRSSRRRRRRSTPSSTR